MTYGVYGVFSIVKRTAKSKLKMEEIRVIGAEKRRKPW